MNKLPLFVLTLAASLAFADAASRAEFARPHRLVDIGGRRLNLFCGGTGAPTAVFESPSGGAGREWWAVQPRVGLLTDIAHSSTRRDMRVVAGAGHAIQETRPEAVVSAVDDVLPKLRR